MDLTLISLLFWPATSAVAVGVVVGMRWLADWRSRRRGRCAVSESTTVRRLVVRLP